MCHFNYKALWEKFLNMFRPSNKNVYSYGHQGLSEVVHKWVKSN